MARGIESILRDQRILDWGDKILKLQPDVSPLVVFSKMFGKETAENQVYIDFEDRPLARYMYLDVFTSKEGAPDNLPEQADISLGDNVAGGGADMGGNIYVGDLLYDMEREDFMYVKAITRAAPDLIRVVFDYSEMGTNLMTAATSSGKSFDTADTADSGTGGYALHDRILKVSSVFEDGGVSSNPKAKDLTKGFGFCQKFQTSYSVDRETMLSALNGGPELQRLQSRMAIEHLMDIEYQFIWGKKDARIYEGPLAASAGKYIYTTGGLYHSGMDSDNITVPLTETAFRSFLREGFRYGAKDKLFVGGGLIIEGIDVWSMGRLETTEKTAKTGLHIVSYKMAGGTANILAHPLMEDDMEGMGFLLDPNMLKYKVFDDTKLSTGIQANNAQERLDQYITQVGTKLGLLEHHRRIKGVTSIAG